MATQITRSNAEALIPEEVTREIFKEVPAQSAVMSLARRLPNMTRAQTRMPVMSGLVTGGFVNGDTGQKTTSNAEWANKYLDAEEIAVIVPIPEAVLDDTDYDIWAEVKPQIVEEFGRIFDAAVLFGTNAPSSWPTDIRAACAAASHTIDLSTQVAAGDDLYDILLGNIAAGTPGVFGLVEHDGYGVTGAIAHPTFKSSLRGLRDANGQPIFMRSMANGQNLQGATRYELDGQPIGFVNNGSFDTSSALLFAGDWSKVVWAMRQDITYKILDQAVIQGPGGDIIYNLAQQDMVALRAVMRIAWQVPNPINRMETTEANRYPIAALVP